jgi:hypothetical protein
MTVGYAQTFAPRDGFVPVADTASAVTYDLELNEIVLIVAAASTANRRRLAWWV